MEIHPPSKPVESVKDFFLHLSMITIGILIAMGLEQSVEAWHHHRLAEEARENIIREIRDNKKELDATRLLVKQDLQSMQRSLETVRAFLAHNKSTKGELGVRGRAADLHSTSWTTAINTGAIAYMGYDQAKRFTPAYDAQARVVQAQDEMLRIATRGLASMDPRPPDQWSEQQLRDFESNVRAVIGSLVVWDQLAAQVSQIYATSLKE